MPQTPSKPTPLSLYVSNPICCLLAPGKRSDRRPGLSLGTPSLHQPGGRQGARGALPAPRRSPGGGPGFYPSPASTPAPPPPAPVLPPRLPALPGGGCGHRRRRPPAGVAARPRHRPARPGPARRSGTGHSPVRARGAGERLDTPPHPAPACAPGGGGGGSNGAGVGRRGAFPGVRSGTGSWCLYNCVCPPAPSCLGAGVGGCVCVPRSPAGRAVPLPGEKGS